MTDATPAAPPEPEPTPTPLQQAEPKPQPDKPAPTSRDKLEIVVRPLPKIIFFYPTWIVSGLFALFPAQSALIGQIWMGLFFFNLLVIASDFNEERSLIVALTGVAGVFGLLYFGVLGNVGTWLSGLQPEMNQTFYSLIFFGFALIYLFVWLRSRFEYWTFRPNEVVYRYGVFPKMKRYSTEDLRWDKEVPDVLERLLAGAGRIILTTPHERHPIIIEHVTRIGLVDDKIADLLGVKAVIHTETRE